MLLMIYINKDWQLIIIIIIFKKSALQGWKTADAFYQSEYPKPHEANSKKELGKRKRENSRRQKGREQLTPMKKHRRCSLNPPVLYHRTHIQYVFNMHNICLFLFSTINFFSCTQSGSYM